MMSWAHHGMKGPDTKHHDTASSEDRKTRDDMRLKAKTCIDGRHTHWMENFHVVGGRNSSRNRDEGKIGWAAQTEFIVPTSATVTRNSFLQWGSATRSAFYDGDVYHKQSAALLSATSGRNRVGYIDKSIGAGAMQHNPVYKQLQKKNVLAHVHIQHFGACLLMDCQISNAMKEPHRASLLPKYRRE